MKNWQGWVCVCFMFGLWIAGRAGAEVFFQNHYQTVSVKIVGDGEVLEQDAQNNDTGLDTDVYAEADYWGYAWANSRLKTAYATDRLTVDGRLWMNIYPAWEIEELSVEAEVYYQTVITVTDQPAWLKISGYLTTEPEHQADDHFLVGAPIWFWDVDYHPGQKVWMFDTALFDVGEHYLYGGVRYTLATTSTGLDDTLYADYYFAVEVVDEPEFDPSDADLNHDGKVNLEDLALFASVWMWGGNG